MFFTGCARRSGRALAPDAVPISRTGAVFQIHVKQKAIPSFRVRPGEGGDMVKIHMCAAFKVIAGSGGFMWLRIF